MKSTIEFDNLLHGLKQTIGGNPFVGLRSYEANEGHLFFGRDEQTKELLLKLHDKRFLAVVGRSGCGKSSIIKAGLIPKLKSGFLTGNRDYWLIATLRPSGDPLKAFVNAINEALVPDDTVSEKPDLTLTIDEVVELGCACLIEKMKAALLNNRFNLLILVDQFEELFTYKTQTETQKNENVLFVNLLIGLAREQGLPVFTIITMRSDYIGHCNLLFDLPELMNNAQYLIPKLKWHQIKEVIEFPVKLCGEQINPGLLDKITNESDKELDQLPVLQHCMMRTYRDWASGNKAGAIEFENYKRTGGLDESIKNHANDVFDSLTDIQKQVAKCLFQSITEITPYNEKIRRPQKYDDILNICKGIEGASEDDLKTVIDKFREKNCAFLTSSEKPDHISAHAVIDISHESLLRQWDLLSKWMTEEEVLSKKYKRFVENVKNKNELLTGIDLKDAVNWKKEIRNNCYWAKQYDENFDNVEKYIEQSLEKYNRNKRKNTGFQIGLLILTGVVIFGAVKLYINEKIKSTDAEYQKAYEAVRLDSGVKANTRLAVAMSKFGQLKITDSLSIKSSLNDVLLKYSIVENFYKKIIFNKYSDNLEKVNLINELQGYNYQIKDLVGDKLNLSKSYEQNYFIYREIVNRFLINVELGKQKFNLVRSKANQIDLSKRYGALAFRQLFIKDFKGAVKSGKEGLNIYPQNDWIYTNLAAAYLLDNQFTKAEEIYSEYKRKVFTNREKSFREAFKEDLNNLETKGIITDQNKEIYENVQKIRTLLIRD